MAEDLRNWDDILQKSVEKAALSGVLQGITSRNVVATCLQHSAIRRIIDVYIESYVRSDEATSPKKSFSKSVARRLIGNNFFIKKEYRKSLYEYNCAVLIAPEEGDCLALALASRSAALFHLHLIKECLNDIELALQKGYPVAKASKVILRKGMCLWRLGRSEETRRLYEDALSLNDQRDTWDEFMNRMSIQLHLITNDMIDPFPRPVDPNPIAEYTASLKGGPNTVLRGACNAIEMRTSNEKGRHMIAKTDIELGDLLYVETPFCHVVLKDNCNYCCKPCIATFPCDKCVDVTYCCEPCRISDWSEYHQYECGYVPLLKSVGVAYLGLRVALKAQYAPGTPGRCNHRLKYDVEGYSGVYNLITLQEYLPKEDLMQYAMTALMLSVHLRRHTSLLPCGQESCLGNVATLVLRHITQIVGNGHAITRVEAAPLEFSNLPEEDDPVVHTVTQDRVATAIYPSASMMNHSCDPNIFSSFHESTLIVRAAKKIKAGQEIFNCYGPHYRRTKTRDRQRMLRDQYFFKCCCGPCNRKFEFLMLFESMLCPLCQGPMVPLSQQQYRALEDRVRAGTAPARLLRDPDDSHVLLCLDCNRHQFVEKAKMRKQLAVQEIIRIANERLDNNDSDTALLYFLEVLRMGQELFYKHHKNMLYAADQAARCLVMEGDLKGSVELLDSCLPSLAVRYGDLSVEVGHELLKITDIQLKHLCKLYNYRSAANLNETITVVKSCSKNLDRVKLIFTYLYGPQHSYIHEVKEKMEELKIHESHTHEREKDGAGTSTADADVDADTADPTIADVADADPTTADADPTTQTTET